MMAIIVILTCVGAVFMSLCENDLHHSRIERILHGAGVFVFSVGLFVILVHGVNAMLIFLYML